MGSRCRDRRAGANRPQGPPMAETRADQTKIIVPVQYPMVSLLGSGDTFLKVIEQAFPKADIHVRGNEITLNGDTGEADLVRRLVDELVLMLRTGQPLTTE